MIEIYNRGSILHLPPGTLYRLFYRSDRWSTFRKCKKISKLHCETGPACKGPMDVLSYFLDGKCYSKMGWEREMYKRNLKKIL